MSHMLVLGAYWNNKVWGKAQQARNTGPRKREHHILRKRSVHDRIFKNPTQMWARPSHVGVRVLGCIVMVLTQFCSINKEDYH
jgi:hypothetical protein